MKKVNRNVVVDGREMSLLAACREKGFSYDALYEYMRRNDLSAQEAFNHYIETSPTMPKAWTQAEIDTLQSLADAGYSSTYAAKILDRPILSVRKKAVMLGISFHSQKHLSKEDIEWFKSNFRTMTYASMAKALGVDVATLQYWGKRLGLTKPRKNNKTVNVTKTLAGKLTDKEISEVTGKSLGVIRAIACENRISLACPERSGRRPWTPEEDEILRTWYPQEGYKSLSKRLGTRSPGTVRTRLTVIGLRRSV